MTCSITAFTATEKPCFIVLPPWNKDLQEPENTLNIYCVSYELYAFIKHDLNYNVDF